MSFHLDQPNSPAVHPRARAIPSDSSRTLIDQLLAEQQQLTAVERFARNHQDSDAPAQARYYQDLIPLGKPQPGEQFAFAVDLDACTGCKACVSACHSLNGLDEDETWRNVGLLHGGTGGDPYQQVVTSACHHCVDPACLNGCPVLAYEKDPVTGIVRHLDDQCIGCQYCVLKCPYDVPKYSARRGIVRKCDMCHARLASGEAPACVQACPSGAISIQLVNTSFVERSCASPGQQMLPGAFESYYTKPTTTYTSRKPIPENARGASAGHSRPEPAHWPLVWMLILTQTAAGMFLASWITSVFNMHVFAATRVRLATIGITLLVSGLSVSILHLGRPRGAWRAFLGLRRSWMSREIVAFGLFSLATGANLAFHHPFFAASAAALGILSVFCSAMIYIDTRRPSWRASLTFPRFFGTTLVLGSAATAAILNGLAFYRTEEITSISHIAAGSSIFIGAGLFLWEKARQSRSIFALFALSTVSGLLVLVTSGRAAFNFAAICFVSTFVAQIIDRYFFFINSTALRMPGTAAP